MSLGVAWDRSSNPAGNTVNVNADGLAAIVAPRNLRCSCPQFHRY
jgi:hypothetical protein